MNKNLTSGSVFNSITLFALPMLLGNILQQTYNVVDTWVVGQFISSNALASVGSAYTLMTFLTSILIGLSMGSGIVFSLCFGSHDEKNLEHSLSASFILIAIVMILLTIIPLILLNNIVHWLNIPKEIIDITSIYLQIIFCGIPAVFLYNYFAAYLKSVGNSIMPLAFLGISTIINIILDLFFVVVCRFGISGAAYATIIAQYISGIGIALYVLKQHSIVRSALTHVQFHKSHLKQIAGYSIFTCLQ